MGLPGCGKSAYAQRVLGSRYHTNIISSDAIRKELTGDENRQDANAKVFDIFHRRIESHLRADSDTVADSTALDEQARMHLRNLAYNVPAEAHLIVFRNVDEALTRNLHRERVVPPEVMIKMLDKYERALLALPFESYHSVTHIQSVTTI